MTEASLAKPQPRIDHPAELDAVVGRLVEQFAPRAIYLFGLRARGDAAAGSNYDLMIVVPDDFPPDRATPSKAFELISGRRIPMDAGLVRAARFADRARRIGTLSYEVAREGLRLNGR